MKQTNKVSPLLGRKPPAAGALSHPLTSVHPQAVEKATSSKLSSVGNILGDAILAKLSNTRHFLNGDYWEVLSKKFPPLETNVYLWKHGARPVLFAE